MNRLSFSLSLFNLILFVSTNLANNFTYQYFPESTESVKFITESNPKSQINSVLFKDLETSYSSTKGLVSIYGFLIEKNSSEVLHDNPFYTDRYIKIIHAGCLCVKAPCPCDNRQMKLPPIFLPVKDIIKSKLKKKTKQGKFYEFKLKKGSKVLIEKKSTQFGKPEMLPVAVFRSDFSKSRRTQGMQLIYGKNDDKEILIGMYKNNTYLELYGNELDSPEPTPYVLGGFGKSLAGALLKKGAKAAGKFFGAGIKGLFGSSGDNTTNCSNDNNSIVIIGDINADVDINVNNNCPNNN